MQSQMHQMQPAARDLYNLTDLTHRSSFPFPSYTTFHLHTHSASRHNGRKSAPLAPPSLITSLHQKLRVLISMELDGVTNVQPADDYYEYFFTVSRF